MKKVPLVNQTTPTYDFNHREAEYQSTEMNEECEKKAPARIGVRPWRERRQAKRARGGRTHERVI